MIDLGDATLLPGFIDAHTHLDGQFQKDYYKAFYEQMFRFPVEQAHTAAVYAKRTLEAGFTTVRNVGAGDWQRHRPAQRHQQGRDRRADA